MDTAMGYDLKDPSKSHHPLVNGRISLRSAHNVIHWGLNIVLPLMALFTLWVSPAPVPALIALLIWVAWGFSYNNGLSKESLYGFIPISVCFASWAAWGWLLSHETLGGLGWLYVIYMFFTILYQISWSGFIKDFGMEERSNILVKLGARMTSRTIPASQYFEPGPKAMMWAVSIKFLNIAVLLAAFYYMNVQSWIYWVWVDGMLVLIGFFLLKAVIPRPYIREDELKVMSVMEILTIYMPLPLFVGWPTAIVMMIAGVLYFVGVNKWLWGKSTPGV